MIEEDKTVETDTTEEETLEENTDVESTEESTEESEDSNIEKPKEGEIDYKAQLEAETAKREKAEKLLAEQAYKDREGKRKGVDNDVVEDDDDLSDDRIKKLIAQGAEQARKEARQYEAERIANSISTSEDEKTLIMMKWQGMSFDESVSLGEQLEDAMVLVNKKKLVGERNEAMRKISSQSTANRDGSSSRGVETKPSGEKLDAGDKQVLSETGFEYNPSTRRYEKKLGSGAVLVRDPKTGALRKA